MLQVIVRYVVRPEHVAENEQLVRAVCEELNASAPQELRYAAFQLDDGVSFVHVAVMAEGQNPLSQVAAFQRFKQGLADRCDERPVRSEARLVGSFRAFS
jgi:hypothetical protein